MKTSNSEPAAAVAMPDCAKRDVVERAPLLSQIPWSCAVIVVATLTIIVIAGSSRTIALWLVGVEIVFALRSVLGLMREPVVDFLLRTLNYPGTRSADEVRNQSYSRAFECFFFVGSILVLSPLFYA